jgi:4-amino-4-deoxy-L-arabinose transferase-like glycosyltransferase
VFFQSPLYSYLLAGWIALFGWSVWGLALVQVALVLGAVGLARGLLRHFRVPPRGRLLALAVLLAYPLLPFYAAMLHKTAVELALHVLVLYAGVRLLASPEPAVARWALGFGLACGLTALVRATFVLVAPLALMLLGPRRRRAALLLLAGCLPPLAWAVAHNARVTGEWGLLSTNAGYTLYLGNNRGNPEGTRLWAPGISNNPLREEASSHAFAERVAGRPLGPREANRVFLAEVLGFARQAPAEFVRMQLRKLYWYLHHEELPDNECYRCLAAEATLLGRSPLDWRWVVLLILPALGALALDWRRAGGAPRDEAFLVAYAGLLAATLVVFYPSSRLRAGHVPVWIVLVAVGLSRVPGLLQHRAGGRRLAIGLALGILLVPGLFMAFRPPIDLHPDPHLVQTAHLYLDLGGLDPAEHTARRIRTPATRQAVLDAIAARRGGAPPGAPYLLGPVIPRRLP